MKLSDRKLQQVIIRLIIVAWLSDMAQAEQVSLRELIMGAIEQGYLTGKYVKYLREGLYDSQA